MVDQFNFKNGRLNLQDGSSYVSKLHLVAAQVFVVQIFQPAPQFFLGRLIGGVRNDLRHA